MLIADPAEEIHRQAEDARILGSLGIEGSKIGSSDRELPSGKCDSGSIESILVGKRTLLF